MSRGESRGSLFCARYVKLVMLGVFQANALVAQWIEHGSPKAGVVGSIPIGGTFCCL